MTHFVLVHGGAHGAWCWQRLVPLLEADPRIDTVLAVDLCGHGARLDSKPQEAIRRADYVASVIEDISARDLRDVVLVGHSLAGITVPDVAAQIGERLRHLVYLSTINPPPGTSVNDLMAQHPLSPLSRLSQGQVSFEQMFCNDLDADSTQWLLSQLCAEPEGPMAEAMPDLQLPRSLPSTYIVLQQDEALPPALQREQARNAGAQQVLELDAGHSVFASRPDALARALLDLL